MYHRNLMLARYDISWDKENAQHIKLSQLRGPQPAIQTICKVLLQRTDKTTDRLLTLFISPKHADRKILIKNYGSRSKKGEIPRFELSHNALNRKPQK